MADAKNEPVAPVDHRATHEERMADAKNAPVAPVDHRATHEEHVADAKNEPVAPVDHRATHEDHVADAKNAGELLGESLHAARVRVSFGPEPLPGLPHRRVDDATLAALLADADGRLGPGPGVAWDGRTLRISSRPGGNAGSITVLDDLRRITAALEPATRAARHGAATRVVEVAIDLATPMNVRARPRPAVDYQPFSGRVLPRGASVAMLVGPGVVRRGGVDGLRAFAGAAGLPVANTWGAKGVLRWDSPHHMGTCGLQANDFELLGLGGYDMLVTSGLDADEARPELLHALGVPLVDLAPEQLHDLAGFVSTRHEVAADTNALYRALSSVAQPGYVDDRSPLHPARAVAQLGASRPPGGVVAADPGSAGLWLARTFPTTDLGSVVVPATSAPGSAAALALCARDRGVAAAAVTTAPADDTTLAVCALADSMQLGFPLFIWGDDGTVRTPSEHERACAAISSAATATNVERFEVAIDFSLTDALIDAAGDVVAWT
jgi:hypothetical protein